MHLTTDKQIWIPDEDNWSIWGADWELVEFDEIIKHHITKWDVALDVGAHVGIWSRNLAQNFKKVYAFEPISKHIDCWKQNMLSWKDNSILHEVALGHKNGTVEIQVPDLGNSGMAAIVQPWLEHTDAWENGINSSKIEVPVRTLDSYEFDQVDFIKIDVEWFEVQFLKGAKNTIRKHKPIIYIEINDTAVYETMSNIDPDYKVFYTNNPSLEGNKLFKIDSDFDTLDKYCRDVSLTENVFYSTPAIRHALVKLKLKDIELYE
jgi:FkbM family methyltransferase